VKLLVLAVLVVAGTGGGAYVLWPKSPASPSCAPVVLTAAGKAEVARNARRIELRIMRSRYGREVMWSDFAEAREVTFSYGPRGKLTDLDLVVGHGRATTDTSLSYGDKTWEISHQALLPFLGVRPAVESAEYRVDLRLPGTRQLPPTRIRGRAALHFVRIVHYPRHREVVPRRLRRRLPKGFKLPAEWIPAYTTRTEAWLDPVTYLALRVREGVLHRTDTTTDEWWVSRTPRNLAHFRLRIPAGFHRLRQSGSGSISVLFATKRADRICAQS
jgi:hypothetical protein